MCFNTEPTSVNHLRTAPLTEIELSVLLKCFWCVFICLSILIIIADYLLFYFIISLRFSHIQNSIGNHSLLFQWLGFVYVFRLRLCFDFIIIVHIYIMRCDMTWINEGMQGCSDASMGMSGHMSGMGGYSSMNVRSPHSQAMLLPGHPHAAMMMAHPSMGHPGLPPQSSPYDASSGHIMDIHAS